MLQYRLFIVLAPITTLLSIPLAVYAWRHRRMSGAYQLFLYLVVVIGFLINNILELSDPTEAGTFFWTRFNYLFISFVPVTWFAFVLAYTGYRKLMSPSRFWVFLVSPTLTFILALTNPLHHLIWHDYTFLQVDGFLAFYATSYGAWFWVHIFYSYGLILAGVLLVLGEFFFSHNLYTRQSVWIIIGVLIPLVANMLFVFRVIPGLIQDPSPIAFAATGLAFFIGIFKYHLFDIMPVARALLVDEIEDAVIVLDQDDRIVDINPAARWLLYVPAKNAVGQTMTHLAPFWREMMQDTARDESFHKQIDLMKDEKLSHFDLRSSLLVNVHGEKYGRLVMLRDATERVNAQQALQAAHDELEQKVRERTAQLQSLNDTLEQRVMARTQELSALYEVSAAASQAITLERLLNESLRSTAISLKSDSGLVYLSSHGAIDPQDQTKEIKFDLMASYGIFDPALKVLDSWVSTSEPVRWVIEHGEGLLIPDTITDPRIPLQLHTFGSMVLLLVPLKAESRVWGVMGLARRSGPVFNVEEVALLASIADQVGIAVHNDQLRQAAQQTKMLEERQRLSQDLHDSLTQTLYSLVTLSEVGQAQLEARAEAAVAKTLNRMGTSARQALKEMRLFIHELRPSVLQEEGLVGALLERMAAVEGRADVKAQLIADQDLHLEQPLEEGLYRIAMEALNNTLKHANASCVTVSLKAEDDHIVMEINDDGRGFDPAMVRAGGMGLPGIRDRVKSMNGRVDIVSDTGCGTRIHVVIPDQRKALNGQQ